MELDRPLASLIRAELDQLPLPTESQWVPKEEPREHAGPARLLLAGVAAASVVVALGALTALERQPDSAAPFAAPSAAATARLSEPAASGGGTASFARIYTTVAELARDATVAGIVEVDRVESFDFKRIPMMRVTGRIARVAKGSISEGSQVTFVYDGPLMSAGQRHIVFLRPNPTPALGADFAVVGGLMGDFPVSADGIIRHAPGVSLDDPALVVLRSVDGRSVDEVFREIR